MMPRTALPCLPVLEGGEERAPRELVHHQSSQSAAASDQSVAMVTKQY
jgi:hypothetical protein